MAGRRRLLAAIATGEGMLASALGACTGEPAFPAPAVRAIAGGICAILALRLEEGEAAGLAGELTEWTLAQIAPRAAEAPARLAELLRARMRRRATVDAPVDPTETARPPVRERLLDSAMQTACRRGGGQLSAIEIADGARVPIEAFFELFDDGPHCLRVAFAESGREIVDLAMSAGGAPAGSPQSIRLALAALLEHFATRPDRAHALTGAALCRIEEPRRQARELTEELGAALQPGPHARDFLREATIGALGHTIRVHLAQERAALLPAVSDQLIYVVLAPLLGARQAIETLAVPS